MRAGLGTGGGQEEKKGKRNLLGADVLGVEKESFRGHGEEIFQRRKDQKMFC